MIKKKSHFRRPETFPPPKMLRARIGPWALVGPPMGPPLGPGPWALSWALVAPCGDRALRGPGP